MSTELKSAWTSKGVWGGAIAVIAAIGGLFGWSIAEADQAAAVEAVALVVSGIGGLIAVWGRIAATARIG